MRGAGSIGNVASAQKAFYPPILHQDILLSIELLHTKRL